MIRNIIFDMGNVLMRFDPRLFIHRLGITGEDETLLLRQVFRSVEWVRMDRGTLTDAQAAEMICRRMPLRLHEAVRALVCQWDDPMICIDGMYAVVEALKNAGYGLFLLSNASVRQHEYWPRIPASRFFDGTFISCDHHLVKPQPEIYQKMLATFGLEAETCLFIDDSPANVEAASLCGIRGIVFHGDVSELCQTLHAYGVKADL